MGASVGSSWANRAVRAREAEKQECVVLANVGGIWQDRPYTSIPVSVTDSAAVSLSLGRAMGKGSGDTGWLPAPNSDSVPPYHFSPAPPPQTSLLSPATSPAFSFQCPLGHNDYCPLGAGLLRAPVGAGGWHHPGPQTAGIVVPVINEPALAAAARPMPGA